MKGSSSFLWGNSLGATVPALQNFSSGKLGDTHPGSHSSWEEKPSFEPTPLTLRPVLLLLSERAEASELVEAGGHGLVILVSSRPPLGPADSRYLLLNE